MSCIYILIGRHTFPGWIHKNEFQKSSFIDLYMISIYYIITTLTTVGYGDIASNSLEELFFRLILLAIGIIAYSWLISSISNRINKENFATINFTNDCQILEKIRISHKNLPYSLYLDIINHLKHKHFLQQKYDKFLLINSLPYSLKNDLIFSMYKSSIEKFDFFKNVSNSNFLVESLSCFSPISVCKDDILLKENDLIEEVYFVREGKLALEVSINIDNPDKSINKYLSNEFLNFAFDFDPNLALTQLQKSSKLSTLIGGTLFNFPNNKEKKTSKNVYLKIHNIHKNEDYGGLFMFFGKRTPFALRAKTKRVQLYFIKRKDFINLCCQYKNIFKALHKKKKHNLNIIKYIFIRIISTFCNTKGIVIPDKYKDTIEHAVNELNKEIIPFDAFKNKKMDNSYINEIDDEINQTLKDFDTEFSHLYSSLTLKEKRKINIKIRKVNSLSNYKNEKSFFLEDFHLSSGFDSKYSSSLYTNKIKKNKKKKIKNTKNRFKSGTLLNTILEKINFDFDENGSEKTIKLNDEENEISSNGPKTINDLPKSLIESLKRKIEYEKLLKKKDRNNEKISKLGNLDSNNNLEKHTKNIDNKILDNEESINNIHKNTNVFSYNKQINKIKKEEMNLTLKNKKTNKTFNKKNQSNQSLFSLKKNIELSKDFIYNIKDKKEIISSNKANNFNSENLFSISVESFNIKNSYKNINQITNGVYINDQKFQDNAIKYINKYYNNKYYIKHENESKEKFNNSNYEKEKNLNKEKKGNYNKLKKRINSVSDKINRIFSKKNKKSKNYSPKENKKLPILNRKILSSQKLRNKSTKKDLSIISIYDESNTNENQNNKEHKDSTQGKLNFN